MTRRTLWWLLVALTPSCASLLDIPSDVETDDQLGRVDGGSDAVAGDAADESEASDAADAADTPDAVDATGEDGQVDAELDGPNPDAEDAEDAVSEDASPDVAEAGCVADLQTDPRHCGRCGHDCLGGDCENGECKSFLMLGVADGYVLDLVTFGGFVYYTVGGPSRSLGRIDPWTGGEVLVDSASLGMPSGLLVDEDGVYFADRSDDVISYCPDLVCAGGPITLVTGLNSPTDLAAWGDDLYAIDNMNERIVRASKVAPGPFEVMADGEMSAWGWEYPRIAVDETSVYWSEPYAGGDDYVWRVPRVSPWNKVPFSGALDSPAEIEITKDGLLVGTLGGSLLRITPGGQTTSLATTTEEVRGIATDTTHIYWAKSGPQPDFLNGSLVRCELPDCANKETIVTGIDDPWPVANDTVGVYVGTWKGRIHGVAKP